MNTHTREVQAYRTERARAHTDAEAAVDSTCALLRRALNALIDDENTRRRAGIISLGAFDLIDALDTHIARLEGGEA